ncbi:hypothetical protein BCM20_003670 [Clostridium beijerinckii]|uniref:Uncharacterized protein n=1 Tax=Clostridium beijerinckii TaxID=1520 RepID=A0A1S8SF64_CLOBE|nr:hypothetical protein [Clostridium beijerinckii]NRY62575.1 hypothetical protein [Clostridium beijerinckii]NYC03715.1 hypothetical protein [Clostridium beijerinckii]OOM63892.1 hypothetical protein CLBCK_07040 [Clostridium beijerinckii]
MNYTNEKILVCENSRILIFFSNNICYIFRYTIRTVKANTQLIDEYLN